MSEFVLPCELGMCPNSTVDQQRGEIDQSLCRRIFSAIVAADGAGFLEVNPCPMATVVDIGTGEDPVSGDVKTKLGIVNAYKGSSDGEF